MHFVRPTIYFKYSYYIGDLRGKHIQRATNFVRKNSFTKYKAQFNQIHHLHFTLPTK